MSCLIAFSALAIEQWGPYRADYLYAYDGDTVTLLVHVYPGWIRRETVRLKGIDTPEIAGDCPREHELAILARDLVRQWLGTADMITVTVSGWDKYGRAVGTVIADEVDIGEEILSRGYARRYNGGKRESWCPASA